MRRDKRRVRIRQQLIQQTDFLRQWESTNRRGSQTRNKQEEYGQKKWKWGGMKSSTLQKENKNITAINNEKEIEEDGNSGQVTSQKW